MRVSCEMPVPDFSSRNLNMAALGDDLAAARSRADFLNAFVREKSITSISELFCGDISQLALSAYPQYLGVAATMELAEECSAAFAGDFTKCFIPYSLLIDAPQQELVLSLSVIHRIQDEGPFYSYMRTLFYMATRYVIIHSTNVDRIEKAAGLKYRNFNIWISQNILRWQLEHEHKEEHCNGDDIGFGFFVYKRTTL